uniref:COP9 signalosome complex subunit 9 n=1 Tax=Amphiprion percula TaxID=161767 RepID=A0A3P8SM84_AMPPE
MKPAVDEMFPEGAGPYVDLDEAGGSSGLLMDLAANEKAVHSDFFNGNFLVRGSIYIDCTG